MNVGIFWWSIEKREKNGQAKKKKTTVIIWFTVHILSRVKLKLQYAKIRWKEYINHKRNYWSLVECKLKRIHKNGNKRSPARTDERMRKIVKRLKAKKKENKKRERKKNMITLLLNFSSFALHYTQLYCWSL